MVRFLSKIFIKNYKNVDDLEVRNSYGKLSGIVGVITNLTLSIIKVIAGILSSSMAIIADGLNNLSDTTSSIITLVGFKLSAKPADKDHPFGHQRAEYITGLIVSFFILFIGATLLKSGIENAINPVTIIVSPLIIIFLIISILIKIWQYFFYRYNGKLINSKTLIATSVDSLNDVITTLVVLVSILLVYFFDINLDAYMTILVSIFIIISGIQLIKETTSLLLGESPSKDLIKNITDDILSFKGVLGIHDLIIHTYGPNKSFSTVHVEVNSKVDIMISHNLIDSIERYISDKYKTNLVVHMDPVDINDEYTNHLKEKFVEILKKIDAKLSFHDFRVVKTKNRNSLIFDLEVPFDYEVSNGDLKNIIKNELKEIDDKINVIINFDIMFFDDE